MSIRDELLKWANDEQVRGNPVSIQEIAEHAQGLAQKQEAGALRLLADIRIAAGDPYGRLMQDELVDHIVDLNKKVSENDALAAHVKRLSRLWLDMDDCEAESDEQMELMAEMHDAIRDHYNDSETSLAKLKAQWQAEALGRLLAEVTFAVEADTVRAHIRNAMRRLRRQAEEAGHDT